MAPLRLPLALRPAVPVVEAWVRRTAARGLAEGRRLADFRFPRLADHFRPAILEPVRVVVCETLPTFPLPGLALTLVQRLARGTTLGITFQDTYFLAPGRELDEGLHFHELVHVVQWRLLGARDFIHAYGCGLLDGGYQGCPLETTAFGLERRFRQGGPAWDVEQDIQRDLQRPGPRLRPV